MYKNDTRFDIITASEDNTLKRWNIAGECITTFIGHNVCVTCVIYDETSNRMFSSSYGGNNNLLCWDVDTGDKIAALGHKKDVNSICFINSSPLKIASASNDCTIKIWDTNPFRCIKTLPYNNNVYRVVGAPDGIHLISSGFKGKIKIWNTITSSDEIIDYQFRNITSLNISTCGKYIVSGDSDGELMINQLLSPFPTRLHTCELLINNVKNTINILSDGTITASTSEQIYKLTVNDYIIKDFKDFNIIIENKTSNNKIELTTNSKKELEELVEILLALQNCLALENCNNEIETILTRYRFDIFQSIITIPRNLLEIIEKYLKI